jgi:REP element-mobilizing transposase RayT
MSDPVAYLITFRTYGTWLHGDARGSVDRDHNDYGTPLLAPNPGVERAQTTSLRREPVAFSESRRTVVADAVRDVCTFRGWTLWALNVRGNHVHAVVGAPQPPEQVMQAFKSNATRVLRERGLEGRGARIWSRHGSTRYLWKEHELREGCRYVAESQGTDMGGEL